MIRRLLLTTLLKVVLWVRDMARKSEDAPLEAEAETLAREIHDERDKRS